MWRRFLLAADATFADLHAAIQAACGWLDCHLFEFTGPDGQTLAGSPDDEGWRDEPVPEAGGTPVAGFFDAHDRCRYAYDFGDDWQHAVVREAVVERDERFHRRLVGGARAFPPGTAAGSAATSGASRWRAGRHPRRPGSTSSSCAPGWATGIPSASTPTPPARRSTEGVLSVTRRGRALGEDPLGDWHDALAGVLKLGVLGHRYAHATMIDPYWKDLVDEQVPGVLAYLFLTGRPMAIDELAGRLWSLVEASFVVDDLDDREYARHRDYLAEDVPGSARSWPSSVR